MDCEGCEYKALLGADLSNVKTICMELHRWEDFFSQQSELRDKIMTTHNVYHERGASHKVITFIKKEDTK